MDRTGGDDPDDPHESGGQAPEEQGMFWRVPPGQTAVLVAAYRSAVRQADELVAALATAGLADQVVSVTAGLDAAGEPLVCGVVTLAGARRLAEFLAAGGPPPPGLQLRDGRPPWAA